MTRSRPSILIPVNPELRRSARRSTRSRERPQNPPQPPPPPPPPGGPPSPQIIVHAPADRDDHFSDETGSVYDDEDRSSRDSDSSHSSRDIRWTGKTVISEKIRAESELEPLFQVRVCCNFGILIVCTVHQRR